MVPGTDDVLTVERANLDEYVMLLEVLMWTDVEEVHDL